MQRLDKDDVARRKIWREKEPKETKGCDEKRKMAPGEKGAASEENERQRDVKEEKKARKKSYAHNHSPSISLRSANASQETLQ